MKEQKNRSKKVVKSESDDAELGKPSAYWFKSFGRRLFSPMKNKLNTFFEKYDLDYESIKFLKKYFIAYFFLFFLLLFLVFGLSWVITNIQTYFRETSIPKLNSIFELKLGMNEKGLRKVVDITALSDTVLSTSEYIQGEDLLSEKDKVKTIYLAYYEVDLDYQLKDIVLFFYRDKLFEIRMKDLDSKTENLLDEKYGKDYGKMRRLKPELSFFTTWETGSEDVFCYTISQKDEELIKMHHPLFLFNEKTKQEILAQRRRDGQKKMSNKELLDAL